MKHKQVTTCLRGGGPTSDRCSCNHCTLGVCSVCGAYEGGLTTDCPGVKVDFDRQEEVYKTNLDYTDKRGWHQGEPMEKRSPQFEKVPEHAPRLVGKDGVYYRISGCTCGWEMPPTRDALTQLVRGARADDDDVFALHVATANISRVAATQDQRFLENTLARKAVAWVLADRICDDRSATLARVEDEIDKQLPRDIPGDVSRALLQQLEDAKICFQLANHRAEKCDDEFRQAARKIVESLEQGGVNTLLPKRSEGTP